MMNPQATIPKAWSSPQVLHTLQSWRRSKALLPSRMVFLSTSKKAERFVPLSLGKRPVISGFAEPNCPLHWDGEFRSLESGTARCQLPRAGFCPRSYGDCKYILRQELHQRQVCVIAHICYCLIPLSHHTHFVVSAASNTLLYRIDDRGQETTLTNINTSHLGDLVTTQPTLAFSNLFRRNGSQYLDSSLVVQVVPKGVILLEWDPVFQSYQQRAIWKPVPIKERKDILPEITAAACNSSQIAVAVAGGKVHLFILGESDNHPTLEEWKYVFFLLHSQEYQCSFFFQFIQVPVWWRGFGNLLYPFGPQQTSYHSHLCGVLEDQSYRSTCSGQNAGPHTRGHIIRAPRGGSFSPPL